MYASKIMEIRSSLIERVNHMVRHIGASASLRVDPPTHKARQLTTHNQIVKEISV